MSFVVHMHDNEKEQCLLNCNVLSLSVSKLSSYDCSNFICCTPCVGFAFVHSLCHLELAVIEVALRLVLRLTLVND